MTETLPDMTEFHIVANTIPVPQGAVIDPDMTDDITAMGHDDHGEFTLAWSGSDTLDGRHIWNLVYFDYMATTADASSDDMAELGWTDLQPDDLTPLTPDFSLSADLMALEATDYLLMP